MGSAQILVLHPTFHRVSNALAGHWIVTGPTVGPVARLIVTSALALEQTGEHSAGQFLPPWLRGINRAILESETAPALTS